MSQDGTFKEAAIEPALPIIDTHHHLWPVLPAHITAGRAYSLDELHVDTAGGHNIVASIYEEASACYRDSGPEHLRPLGETEYILSKKARAGLMSGIIGWADMMLGAKAGEVLDGHLALAGSRFKGTRYSVVWDPHPDVYVTPRRPPAGILLEPKFAEGLAELAKRDLVYECWAYFHQLGELAALARKFPHLRIVLCHLGGPAANGYYASRRKDVLVEWRKGIREVAQCPNVVIKLGAMGMAALGAVDALGSGASSEAVAQFWKPEVDFCIETFGPDRCMFESNFPVDHDLCDYVTLWNAYKRMTAGYSAGERAWLFEKTARRVYRL